AGGLRQLREFVDVFRVKRCAQSQAHEHRAFAGAGAFEHQPAAPSAPASSSTPGMRTLRAGTTVEMACLYTIWFTLFFNSTTNWSNESIVPCSLIPFTR